MGNIFQKLSALVAWNKFEMSDKIQKLIDKYGMKKWQFQKFYDVYQEIDLDSSGGIDSMELVLWMERCPSLLLDDVSSLTTIYYEGFKCVDDYLMWERNVLHPKLRMRAARELTFEEFCGVVMTICVSSEDDLMDMQYRAACRGKLEVTVQNLGKSYKAHYKSLSRGRRRDAQDSFARCFGTFDLSRAVPKGELREAAQKNETRWLIDPMKQLKKEVRNLTIGSAWKAIETKVQESIDRKDVENDTPLKVLAKIVSPKIRTVIVIGEDERPQIALRGGKVKGKKKAWQPQRFKKRKPRKTFNKPNKTFEL